ncbi:MAG: hypothetical protein JW936_10570 [Sedimentisphaerales bacterium]|nr:hypothetical protein [Sedimentisphaerales bacterium]
MAKCNFKFDLGQEVVIGSSHTPAVVKARTDFDDPSVCPNYYLAYRDSSGPVEQWWTENAITAAAEVENDTQSPDSPTAVETEDDDSEACEEPVNAGDGESELKETDAAS